VYDAARDPYLELGPMILPKDSLRWAVYDSIDVAARREGAIRP
jgi:hypothetical protein